MIAKSVVLSMESFISITRLRMLYQKASHYRLFAYKIRIGLTVLNGSEKKEKEKEKAEGKTKVLYGEQQVIGAEIQFYHNSKRRVDTFMNYTRPQLAILLKPIILHSEYISKRPEEAKENTK